MKPRSLAGTAGARAFAGLAAEVVGYRAFSRLVHGDVQALVAGASRDGTGVVTEEMHNISFQAVDATSARVTLTGHGKTATGTLFFDSAGRLTSFAAHRYAVAGKDGIWKRGPRRSRATASSKG